MKQEMSEYAPSFLNQFFLIPRDPDSKRMGITGALWTNSAELGPLDEVANSKFKCFVTQFKL